MLNVEDIQGHGSRVSSSPFFTTNCWWAAWTWSSDCGVTSCHDVHRTLTALSDGDRGQSTLPAALSTSSSVMLHVKNGRKGIQLDQGSQALGRPESPLNHGQRLSPAPPRTWAGRSNEGLLERLPISVLQKRVQWGRSSILMGQPDSAFICQSSNLCICVDVTCWHIHSSSLQCWLQHPEGVLTETVCSSFLRNLLAPEIQASPLSIVRQECFMMNFWLLVPYLRNTPITHHPAPLSTVSCFLSPSWAFQAAGLSRTLGSSPSSWLSPVPGVRVLCPLPALPSRANIPPKGRWSLKISQGRSQHLRVPASACDPAEGEKRLGPSQPPPSPPSHPHPTHRTNSGATDPALPFYGAQVHFVHSQCLT